MPMIGRGRPRTHAGRHGTRSWCQLNYLIMGTMGVVFILGLVVLASSFTSIRPPNSNDTTSSLAAVRARTTATPTPTLATTLPPPPVPTATTTPTQTPPPPTKATPTPTITSTPPLPSQEGHEGDGHTAGTITTLPTADVKTPTPSLTSKPDTPSATQVPVPAAPSRAQDHEPESTYHARDVHDGDTRDSDTADADQGQNGGNDDDDDDDGGGGGGVESSSSSSSRGGGGAEQGDIDLEDESPLADTPELQKARHQREIMRRELEGKVCDFYAPNDNIKAAHAGWRGGLWVPQHCKLTYRDGSWFQQCFEEMPIPPSFLFIGDLNTFNLFRWFAEKLDWGLTSCACTPLDKAYCDCDAQSPLGPRHGLFRFRSSRDKEHIMHDILQEPDVLYYNNGTRFRSRYRSFPPTAILLSMGRDLAWSDCSDIGSIIQALANRAAPTTFKVFMSPSSVEENCQYPIDAFRRQVQCIMQENGPLAPYDDTISHLNLWHMSTEGGPFRIRACDLDPHFVLEAVGQLYFTSICQHFVPT